MFVAGQVGRAPSTGELPEGIEAQTEQTMENIKAILEAAGLTWANVARAMCLLADINDFEAFNGVYSRYIERSHARTFDVRGEGPSSWSAGRDRGHRRPRLIGEAACLV